MDFFLPGVSYLKNGLCVEVGIVNNLSGNEIRPGFAEVTVLAVKGASSEKSELTVGSSYILPICDLHRNVIINENIDISTFLPLLSFYAIILSSIQS